MPTCRVLTNGPAGGCESGRLRGAAQQHGNAEGMWAASALLRSSARDNSSSMTAVESVEPSSTMTSSKPRTTRAFVEHLQLPLELGVLPHIVRVEKRQMGPPRESDAVVARRRRAGARLAVTGDGPAESGHEIAGA